MIASRHRFHGHNSVRNVRGKPMVFFGFRVFYSKRPAGKPYRMAVVVSKKIHKNAVVRNRIRRRLYEAVRQSNILNDVSVDVVFVVQDVALSDTPAHKLQDTVWKACEKIVQRLDV